MSEWELTWKTNDEVQTNSKNDINPNLFQNLDIEEVEYTRCNQDLDQDKTCDQKTKPD